jgi:hypothetical protein
MFLVYWFGVEGMSLEMARDVWIFKCQEILGMNDSRDQTDLLSALLNIHHQRLKRILLMCE